MYSQKTVILKPLLCLLFFLLTVKSTAQDSNTAADSTTTSYLHRKIIFKEYVNLYYFKPVPVGNNVLAKANKGIYGLGVAVNLFTVYNFYLRMSYEFARYDVTDVSLAANVDRTFVRRLSPEIMYKYSVTNNFSLNPIAGIGYVEVKQKTGKRDFGWQEGTVFTLGLNADYRIAGNFKFFTGMHYNMYRPGVTITPEYKDFYHKLNAINIILGIKL